MSDLFSRRERRRPGRREFPRDDEDAPRSDGGLIGWTIFIILLVGLVALCWMGSIYIFGHPEEPLSYSVLHKFKKLEPPKRFIDTAAPKGEFLDANRLLERYGSLNKRELEKESSRLLRDYIRNYDGVRGLVPYVIGNFEILDSYELTSDDFFTSGIVAVAQDSKQPQVLIEHVFTADPKVVPVVHRNLLTGQPIVLEGGRRARDLAAIIGIHRLDDGRLKFTVVPISYPGYAVANGPGSFDLEPPQTLNVEAGLPILSKTKQSEADARYATYRRKLGRPDSDNAAEAPSQLVRIQPALPPEGGAPPAPAVAETTPPEPTPAAPTPTPAVAEATVEPEVRPALPVNAPAPTPSTAVAAATPAPTPEVPLKPFMQNQPAPAITNTASGSWQTYSPGRMPRGKLVNHRDARAISGPTAETTYLQGEFIVTASGQRSAVLRPRGGDSSSTRIIVEFPAGSRPPAEGTAVSRNGQRPFRITSVDRGDDGTFNIRAQEITTE